MNITVQKLPNCMASLSVTIPAEKHAAARNAIFANYSKNAAIPGFRKGKVPRTVIEKRFGAEIEKEVTDKVVNESLREAIKQENLNVLNVADFQRGGMTDGEVNFTVRLFLAPEFELPYYKGLTITVPKIEVTNKVIEDVLQEQREQRATLKPAPEGKAAETGDFISIDYTGSLDGTPLTEILPEADHFIATNSGFLLKLSDDNFVPGFCQQLLGMRTGDTRVATVTMPEEGINELIAGKSIVFSVSAGEIQEAELPELNDDFAASLADGKTLAELRDIIRENSEIQARQKDLQNKRVAAMEALRDKIEFDLPENIVTNAAQLRVNELVKMNMDRGLTQDMLVENETAILEAANNQAKVDVKDEYLLMEVIKKEHLEVTQEDMVSRIGAIALQSRTSPKNVLKSLQKNDGLQNVQHSVILAKALDVLVNHAIVKYKTAEATTDAA